MSDPTEAFDAHAPFGDEAQDGQTQPRRRPRRKPRRKRVTPAILEYWATRHLDRYASSSQNLKQVLARKVERIEFTQEERFPEANAWIENAVARMQERGYLDDRRYADTLCRRLRERGCSRRRLAHELRQKGIPSEIARDVLAQAEPNAEIEAAVRYARRRRLGPFRNDRELAVEKRERDLAALGRAGFSYDTARRIVDAPDPDSIVNAAST